MEDQSSFRILIHFPDEFIYLLLSVSGVTTLDEMNSLLHKTPFWARQLKGPEKVICFLEMWTNGVDFVNEVFHTLNI